MVKRALFVGRFQPVHGGHLETFKHILNESDELIIGIGSSREGRTLENPLTAEERVVMLEKALKEAGIDRARVRIVEIPDIHDDARWVSHVKSLTPEFSVVYSGNPWVQRLFRGAGYEVRVQPQFKRDEFQGMEIRERILKGEKWEHLVPKSVLEFMQEVGAAERLKRLSKTK